MAEWTEDDRDWAECLAGHLDLAPGEQVEHFVIGISAGSGHIDGQPRKVFVITCCRDCKQPTHLMEHVISLLGERN